MSDEYVIVSDSRENKGKLLVLVDRSKYQWMGFWSLKSQFAQVFDTYQKCEDRFLTLYLNNPRILTTKQLAEELATRNQR